MARPTPRGRGRPHKTSQSARANDARPSAVPDVYQEMLAEATSSSPARFGEEGQTVKRRRINGKIVAQGKKASSDALSNTASNKGEMTEGSEKSYIDQQTAFNDSEDSADSDVDWENVGIKDEEKKESSEEPGELDLVLAGDNAGSVERRRTQRRKPVTAAERDMRITIHKMHLVSLLVHVGLRNHWCNDHDVQISLRKLLSKKTLSYLDDDENQSQFQRSRSFMEGLQQAVEAFESRFRVTARGLQRPSWAEDDEQLQKSELPDDIELPMQKDDFRAAAAKLEGSRDTGAQLFCALLRSAGIDARLVCSLQVLPFVTTVKSTTTVKQNPAVAIKHPETQLGMSGEESSAGEGSDSSARPAVSSNRTGLASSARLRLGGPGRLQQATPVTASPLVAPPVKQVPRKRIRESVKPVYWVEAFSAAYQKWVPVDPLVTGTIGKPSQFEPPTSDYENNMAYVIAFEGDGSALDVTRRYAKAYNAKTRKYRVEVTKGGSKWWRRLLRMYRKLYTSDRDDVEDAELAAKEAAEPMPSNVQDFKDHPYYALERHLKRNEVVHPKREAGKVKTGKLGVGGNNKTLEPVYRRQDVQIVRSADSWYRLGREIKTGEQPLKRVQPRRRREAVSEEDIFGDEENSGTPMYAGFQTTPYTAPPVVRGIVPKNAYGNLDVYVPSMVPPGGAHIAHPDTARAAKLLGIHYADAVTGFEFRGRHGTAVIKGAVVASEYKQAIEEVIRGFDYEREEEEQARRSSNALKMWRMFLKGLRIRERIKGYEIEGESSEIREEIGDIDGEEEDEMGGGFIPDADDDAGVDPTAGQRYRHVSRSDAREGGGFMAESSDDDGERPENFGNSWIETPQAVAQETAEDFGGGGFLPEDGESDVAMNEDAIAKLRGVARLEDPLSFQDGANGGLEDDDGKETTHDIHDLKHPPRVPQPTPQVQQEQRDPNVLADIANSRMSPPHHGFSEQDEDTRILQQIFEETASNADGRSNRPTEAFLTPQVDLDIIPRTAIIPEPGQDKRVLEMSTGRKFPHSADDMNGDSRLGAKMELLAPSTGDSETDRGSLLSHDPSDEDADPDWLW